MTESSSAPELTDLTRSLAQALIDKKHQRSVCLNSVSLCPIVTV